MSEPNWHTDPVVLPIDHWLYEAEPAEGCAECAALSEVLERAHKRGDAAARFDAAAKIRHHSTGHNR